MASRSSGAISLTFGRSILFLLKALSSSVVLTIRSTLVAPLTMARSSELLILSKGISGFAQIDRLKPLPPRRSLISAQPILSGFLFQKSSSPAVVIFRSRMFPAGVRESMMSTTTGRFWRMGGDFASLV